MLSKAEFNKNISLYLEAHRFCCKNGYRVSAEAIGYRIPFVRIVVSEPGREEIKGSKTYTRGSVFENLRIGLAYLSEND